MKKIGLIAVMAMATFGFVSTNAVLNSKTEYVFDVAADNASGKTLKASSGQTYYGWNTGINWLDNFANYVLGYNTYDETIANIEEQSGYSSSNDESNGVTAVSESVYNFEGYTGTISSKDSLPNDYIVQAANVGSYLPESVLESSSGGKKVMLKEGYEVTLDGTSYSLTGSAHLTTLGSNYYSVLVNGNSYRSALDTGGKLKNNKHGLKVTLDTPGKLTIYAISNTNETRDLNYIDLSTNKTVLVEKDALLSQVNLRESNKYDISTTVQLSAGSYIFGSTAGSCLIFATSFEETPNYDVDFATSYTTPYYKETLGSLNKIYFVAEINGVDDVSLADCVAEVTCTKVDGTSKTLTKNVGLYEYLVKAGSSITASDGSELFYKKYKTYYVSYTVGVNKESYGGGNVSCKFNLTIGDYTRTITLGDSITK